MNQGGQPGQMPQGGQAQQQNAGARVQMFRPEHMRNLPQLSPDERVKYENGLRALWGSMQNAQPGSPQQMEAHKKIVDFSQQLMLKVRQRGPGSQGQQNSQASNDQGSAAADSATPAAAQTSQGPAAVPAATAQSQPSQQPAARPPAAPVPPFVKQHMDQMTFIPPQNITEQGAEAVAKWTATNKDRLQKALLQMHTTAEKMRNFDNFIKQKQQKGSLTADEQKTLQNIQAMKPQVLKAHQDAKVFVDNFRNDQTARKTGGQNATAQGRPPSISEAPNATANPPARPGPSPQQPSQTNPVDATKNQQAVAGGAPGANGQSGQQQPQTQPQVQPQAQPQAQPQPPKAASSAAPQASPVATTQPAPGSISQPIKVEPGTQQHPPQPPPVNTAIASAAATGLPSAGTPTQNRTPQIATPTTGAPRSLSHQAALSLANQRGPQPAPIPNQTPQQGTPQGTVGTPSSAPPGVMGTAQPPTSGHPHAHPTQQPQALTQKLPIPKQLPEKAAAPPTPVSLAAGGVTPGRPTYTQGGGMAGGVMGNPVLAKLPVVQMEGEGERVLSQKKLNDLVRQVCGGQVEGQEGTSALTPDVEESILNLADSFVDRLLHAACNNAKQRGSKVLEIRDIQLVLERTYNIRIPGYSSDELRTVRKIQPAQGWITKMSAIQAAKVMPGKGDL
ncbi:Transcription initiation factor TFIID subunit 12 [Cytospora mali]|uniref:Transcription initiation factor TFIID subunit 12 n=1 Tax=Cytospora mali TaxID=578113 RepID=A0A194VD39_CYTMA|nr:Transcription initiation factor TFIID subunit 12 [Valsa mali var. pyri (nom. inval.)]